MSLILAKKILKEHPNGFVGCIVEGKRGYGKSSYCIKVMKEVFQTLHDLNDNQAYQMALDHLLFDMDEVIPFLKNAAKQPDMIPVCTWDDAGVHGGNLRWFTNMRQVEMLKAITDTIRTGVTGFLLNCPDKGGLLKVLRGYNDFLVEIAKENGGNNQYRGYQRQARGYNMFKLPSGTLRVYKNFQDHYSCYLPNWVYEKYMVRRNECFIKSVETLERLKPIGRPTKTP